jgi:toxin ParE1/3/4
LGSQQRDFYLNKIFECFNNLTQFPIRGKPREELYAGMRSISVEKHVVYYYLIDNQINIVAILHESMEPDIHIH